MKIVLDFLKYSVKNIILYSCQKQRVDNGVVKKLTVVENMLVGNNRATRRRIKQSMHVLKYINVCEDCNILER